MALTFDDLDRTKLVLIWLLYIALVFANAGCADSTDAFELRVRPCRRGICRSKPLQQHSQLQYIPYDCCLQLQIMLTMQLKDPRATAVENAAAVGGLTDANA